MEKNIEQKETENDNKQEKINSIVELVQLLYAVKVSSEEAELNKVSIKDYYGRRILF